MAKIISAEAAANLVKDNDVMSVNGVCTVCNPDLLVKTLGDRYRETQTPKGLTLWGATALGIAMPGAYADAMFQNAEGLVDKVIMGQFSSTPSIARMIANERVAGFNLPQGIISHLYRAAAGKKPAVISEVGLKTSVDPRQHGGRLNERAKAEPDVATLITIEGKEYLQYETPKLDIAFICGSAADERGNISFDNEAAFVDATTIAMATKANGGIVVVQVEHTSSKRFPAKSVLLPGKVVDYIVVNPAQMQCVFEKSQRALSGESVLPTEKVVPYIEKMVSIIPGNKKRYDQYIIARRAYDEIKSGDVINLGVGIPGLISTIATESGKWDEIVMTNEVGLIGGIPLPVPGFGATLNAQMITDMPTMFDFYDGGNLDGVYVGAAQISPKGDVGVSKVGKIIIGVGGFINLTQSNHKIVFMTSFMDGKGMELSFKEGELNIVNEGTARKFVQEAEQVSFSGELAIEKDQDVMYITERCVFRLTPKGLLLTEIAPGIDLQKDILDNMDFVPEVSDTLKIMDTKYFDFSL